MRIVLNPAARTRSMSAWVTVGLFHAVSLGIPLLLASSEFPRFQPAPMSATSWEPVSWVTTSADADAVRPDTDPPNASIAARRANPPFLLLEPMGVPLVRLGGVALWGRSDC